MVVGHPPRGSLRANARGPRTARRDRPRSGRRRDPWGCVGQVAEQTFDIGRDAVLSGGWPARIPGVTFDRQCGSSRQAVSFAAASVIAGHYDLVVAGGVELMSRAPMGSNRMKACPFAEGFRSHYGDAAPGQGVGAEMVVEPWGFSRVQLDEFSLPVARQGAAAHDEGVRGKHHIARRRSRKRRTLNDSGDGLGGRWKRTCIQLKSS
jgi:acetyl-CoA acetyltransferase